MNYKEINELFNETVIRNGADEKELLREKKIEEEFKEYIESEVYPTGKVLEIYNAVGYRCFHIGFTNESLYRAHVKEEDANLARAKFKAHFNLTEQAIDIYQVGNRLCVDIPKTESERGTLTLKGKLEQGLKIKEAKPESLPIYLGQNCDGSDLYANFDSNTFRGMLIAGQSGMGKTSFTNSLLAYSLIINPVSDLEVYIFDYKHNFENFKGIPGVKAVCSDIEEIRNLSIELAELRNKRQKVISQEGKMLELKGYNHTYPDKKLPYILVIVDEITATVIAENKWRKDEVERLREEGEKVRSIPPIFMDNINELAMTARSAGFCFMVTAQEPKKNEVGRIRDELPFKMCFSTSSTSTANLVFGDNGKRATRLPGIGYALYQLVGSDTILKLQCPFIEDGSHLKEKGDKELQYVCNYLREHRE